MSFYLFTYFLKFLAAQYGMWRGVLVPWPGIKRAPHHIGRQSFNHWATREVPAICHFWAKSLTPLHTFTQSTVLHGLIKVIINNFPKMGVFFNKEKSVLCILGNIMKNC